MRFIRSRNLFAYTFTPRTITGCWLSSSPGSTSFKVHSYHKKTIDHLELEHLYIFNPTRIAALITSWYHAAKQTMPIACTLVGPSVQEQIIPLATAHPTDDQLPIILAPHLQWEYTYLYSYDMAHYFYLCGITKPLLFQYQLLGITTQLPFRTITAQGLALLTAYRFIFGAAFRPAQLATALTKCDTNIEQLFTRDDLERLCILPSPIDYTQTDAIPLLASCGLFAHELL